MGYFINKKADKCLLYDCYKAFYDKEPDFRKENRRNTTIEFQAMIYLLEQYRVMVGNYGFAYNELVDLYMPISMKLQDLLIEMLNHENSEFVISNCVLRPEVEAKIRLIGAAIMSVINKKENSVEALRLLSSIYYTSNSILPNATYEEIAKSNQCSLDDVIEANDLRNSLTLEKS